MRFLTILPEFIPASTVKETVSKILPEMVIVNSLDEQKYDAEVVVATTFTKLGKKELERFPNLKYVQIASTGYDNVDVEEVKRKGAILCNIPTANKQSVAEHVIAFTLQFLKDTIFLNNELRNRNWPMLTGSRDLEGKVFGIVGMGMIGTQLAKRLLPFNVTILYYDLKRLSEEEEEELGVNFVTLDYLLSNSDIISLHLPLTDKTRNMFSEKEFSMMKDGAIFINTARGELVDENSLISAIRNKGIKAGLDVFSKEPPDFNSPLFAMDNVLLSPHIAGVTIESQQRFLTDTISNVLRFAQGLEPLYRVF
ncbi:MAG: 2-hydroxyacid dehydrogenase [Candidatus Thermoplasmatota archaeon]|jgi:phosphoglycerate dehydrogenase-like enzyme|nr:2-hydroxyacid dehydrogenase [Candidatus Thermoplasmatota archaeon]